MRNGMVIIDADGHAADWDPMYHERLPDKFKRRVTVLPTDNFDRWQNDTIIRRAKSPEMNLADNDAQGIDVQVLYPTRGLFVSRVREPEYVEALCRTYNDWLHDWCAVDRNRLKGVALVPLHTDVKAAIAEMERAMGKLGAVGVMVNTYDRGRNVGHRDFWPFYEECARQGVAVSFHAGGTDTFDSIGHFENFLQIHTLSHCPEQLFACTAIMYSGVLEKYQDLRIAFLEAGIGWVPFWVERMDEEYEGRGFEAPLLTQKPSKYMASGRVYVSCEAEEKMIKHVPEFFPAENILFASDYPHWDSKFPDAVDTLAERKDLPDEMKKKIFFDNPKRFYGLKVDAASFAKPARKSA